MKTSRKAARLGCDGHRLVSRITACDKDGRIVWRQRLEHGNRVRLLERLRARPAGTPVILEGTLGWGRLSDKMDLVNRVIHIPNRPHPTTFHRST